VFQTIVGPALSPPNFPVMQWIRSHAVLTGIVAFAVLLIAITSNTSPTNDLLGNPERAVQQGRLYASLLVTGNIEDLMYRAHQAALEKLRNSPPPSFGDLTQAEIYETKGLPLGHSVRAPITAEFSPPESRMQIVKLERRNTYFVMTFAALAESYLSAYIEADGRPLVVSVAVRYLEERPETAFSRWLAQLRNIKLLPSFIREGSSGDWYLIDYRYSFTLREHYDWIRKNEQRLYAEAEQENEKWRLWMESPRWQEEMDKQIDQRVSKETEALNVWGYSACEVQLNDVMHQLSQRTEPFRIPNAQSSTTGGTLQVPRP
jgi:hypothetical protein